MSAVSRITKVALPNPLVEEEVDIPRPSASCDVSDETDYDYDTDYGYETEIPFDEPTLSLDDWLRRDIPAPDPLLGSMLSTTGRMMVAAETGTGKTMFALALGLRIAAGCDFLHWSCSKPRRVLYVDGEMSPRILKARLNAEVERLGHKPPGFHLVCAEDAQLEPLNTRAGRQTIWQTIKRVGGVDLIVFDNVMSLIEGSMIDEKPWADTIKFVRGLTKKGIGQIWLHHTGHNQDRSYGTKTREWQMDTVVVLEKGAKRSVTDVSFKMSFRKARERSPDNRRDFQDVEIALVNDRWGGELADARQRGSVSPRAQEHLDALRRVIRDGRAFSKQADGRVAANNAAWRAECGRLGLIDEAKSASAKALFNKYRKVLADAKLIEIDGETTWLAV